MTDRVRARSWIEPLALLVAGLAGSAALWGRLWVSSPSTRGICGCGDPSLFQWLLAWPAHAIATAHSPVFSRDLFHPAGINLLSNTSVLGLGVPLAPVTWLGGPVLTQNVALLLAVPVAVVAMDLFLRRVTSSLAARVVLSLLYGFSPYVLSSLTVSHLMTAWIGVLPLIALGVVDALAEDRRRARRGAILLVVALVAQFFLSTELLLLSAIVAMVVAAVCGVTWLVTRRPAGGPLLVVRRLWVPLAVTAALLAAPAAYALWGPRSLKGNIWGAGFNPSTGGTSVKDLLLPHAVAGGLTAYSGYSGPAMVQLQYLGWGLLGAAIVLAIWLWRDAVARTAAITMVACLILALSPRYVSWAPWQWVGRLPVLQNVLQFRVVVFALIAAVVVVARGAAALERLGRAGVLGSAAVLAVVALPVIVPEAQGLPLRTVHVAVPSWWRAFEGPGVVLAYPFPGTLLQSTLSWQAHGGFAVSMVGGSGPQATVSRAGDDAAATAILDHLSLFTRTRPVASLVTAAPVRAMVVRDGVTEVVVPVSLHGGVLVTGAPSAGAAAFFIEVLGILPVVSHGAWVFHVPSQLPAPRLANPHKVALCIRLGAAPTGLAHCVYEAAR